MSLPALVSHEILYTSIESVHFTITNVARNAQGYSVSYQICSPYKYNVAQNVQRVTEPLPANTVSFLGRPTCIAWPANYISLVSYLNNCENVLNELILIECPCRHWCHMKFSMHQSSQFTLPLPMWQEMRKGLLCPIRFDHFTSILNHEMCRGSMSHCRPIL